MKKNEDPLKKYKQQLDLHKEIKLGIPAKNLKILLEVKYKLKLKLTDTNTICYEEKM